MQARPAAFGLPLGVEIDAFNAAVVEKYILSTLKQLELHGLVCIPAFVKPAQGASQELKRK